MRRVWGGLVVALAVGGCVEARTEMIVSVDSEIPWGTGQPVQSLVLEVRRGGSSGALRSRKRVVVGDHAGAQRLPMFVGVVESRGDLDTPVWIEALGCRSVDGCNRVTALIAQRAAVRFIEGVTFEVPLLLASGCVGAACGVDERCEPATGSCASAETAPFRRFQGATADGSAGRFDALEARDDASGDLADNNDLDVVVDGDDHVNDVDVVVDHVDVLVDGALRDGPLDAGLDASAADRPLPVDGPIAVDAGHADGSVDGSRPIDVRADVGVPPGSRVYLDPCATNADCVSYDCVALATRGYCSRPCARNADCGDGMLCKASPSDAAHCVFDDVGRSCNPSVPNTCARFCFGTVTAAHCTRECSSGGDCPAGYGCQRVATSTGSMSVCVEIERPCTTADDCPGGVCLQVGSFRGCSAPCRTQADCPARMTVPDDFGRPVALPRYSCGDVGGGTVACIPPLQVTSATGDIVGSDRLGVACGPASPPSCYSGVCSRVGVDTAAACVQRCTPTSGCPSGFACRPLPDTTPLTLACQLGVGSAPVGTACSYGADCVTGLCSPDLMGSGAFCTRYCIDGVCPTGFTCRASGMAIDGLSVSLCLR